MFGGRGSGPAADGIAVFSRDYVGWEIINGEKMSTRLRPLEKPGQSSQKI